MGAGSGLSPFVSPRIFDHRPLLNTLSLPWPMRAISSKRSLPSESNCNATVLFALPPVLPRSMPIPENGKGKHRINHRFLKENREEIAQCGFPGRRRRLQNPKRNFETRTTKVRNLRSAWHKTSPTSIRWRFFDGHNI